MALTFPSYLALSMAVTAAVCGHATYMHRYLYRTMVHLESSKFATLVRESVCVSMVVDCAAPARCFLGGPLAGLSMSARRTDWCFHPWFVSCLASFSLVQLVDGVGSGLCPQALGNMLLATVLVAGKTVQRLFLGSLRFREVERLHLRIREAVIETCLAMTVFRDDFNTNFILMFGMLLFLKVFHWLAKDRIEFVRSWLLIECTAYPLGLAAAVSPWCCVLPFFWTSTLRTAYAYMEGSQR